MSWFFGGSRPTPAPAPASSTNEAAVTTAVQSGGSQPTPSIPEHTPTPTPKATSGASMFSGMKFKSGTTTKPSVTNKVTNVNSTPVKTNSIKSMDLNLNTSNTSYPETPQSDISSTSAPETSSFSFIEDDADDAPAEETTQPLEESHPEQNETEDVSSFAFLQDSDDNDDDLSSYIDHDILPTENLYHPQASIPSENFTVEPIVEETSTESTYTTPNDASIFSQDINTTTTSTRQSVSNFLDNIPELQVIKPELPILPEISKDDTQILDLAQSLSTSIASCVELCETFTTGRTEHANLSSDSSSFEEISNLSIKLDDAIAAEDYELAETLNDQILALKENVDGTKEISSNMLVLAHTAENDHRLLSSSLHTVAESLASLLALSITSRQEETRSFTESELRRQEREKISIDAERATIETQKIALQSENERIQKEESEIYAEIQAESSEEESTRAALLAVQLALQSEVEDLELKLAQKRLELEEKSKQVEESETRLSAIRESFDRKLERVAEDNAVFLREQSILDASIKSTSAKDQLRCSENKATDAWALDAERDIARVQLAHQVATSISLRARAVERAIERWSEIWTEVEKLVSIARGREEIRKRDIEKTEADLLKVQEDERECADIIAECNRKLPSLHADKKVCLTAKNFKQAGVVSGEIAEITSKLVETEKLADTLRLQSIKLCDELANMNEGSKDVADELRLAREAADKAIVIAYATRSNDITSVRLSVDNECEKVQQELDSIKNQKNEENDDVEGTNNEDGNGDGVRDGDDSTLTVHQLKMNLLMKRLGKPLESLYKLGRVSVEKDSLEALYTALIQEQMYYVNLVTEGDNITDALCEKYNWDIRDIMDSEKSKLAISADIVAETEVGTETDTETETETEQIEGDMEDKVETEVGVEEVEKAAEEEEEEEEAVEDKDIHEQNLIEDVEENTTTPSQDSAEDVNVEAENDLQEKHEIKNDDENLILQEDQQDNLDPVKNTEDDDILELEREIEEITGDSSNINLLENDHVDDEELTSFGFLDE